MHSEKKALTLRPDDVCPHLQLYKERTGRRQSITPSPTRMTLAIPLRLLAATALTVLTWLSATAQPRERMFIDENMAFAARQYHLLVSAHPKGRAVMPHSFNANGGLVRVPVHAWTSGFFPGTLWLLADYNDDKALLDSARAYTLLMKPMQHYTGNHDIGFMMMCSYGNAARLAPQPGDKAVLATAAHTLTRRFDKRVGAIKSWNSFRSWHGDSTYAYPVIIDNMMNLELLFYAAQVTGNDTLRSIAVSHADKTLRWQVRPDGSCFHVVCYDPGNGAFIKGETAQGYADNSTWSRGQAWGIYGFTMVYRETSERRFLDAAIRMADFYVNHPDLPADKVPFWDFNAYQPGFVPGRHSHARDVVTNYRDASAAACTASALLELSTYVQGERAGRYFETARTILHTLASPAYRAAEGKNGGFILRHSVGSIPHGSEIDVPLNYADYYFVEALCRYGLLLDKKPLFVGEDVKQAGRAR